MFHRLENLVFVGKVDRALHREIYNFYDMDNVPANDRNHHRLQRLGQIFTATTSPKTKEECYVGLLIMYIKDFLPS